MLNPINHTRTIEGVERYRGEPYAIAADVYAHPDARRPRAAGRGTRVRPAGCIRRRSRRCSAFAAQGVDVQHGPVDPGDVARLLPRLAPVGATTYRVTVTNPNHRSRGVTSATLDGEPVEHQAIPILDDGAAHHVEIVIGRAGLADARVAGTVVGAREFP